ncbi:hypothetical protein [Adhaeribacter terreus]|uniref:Uncharacterized protein n=1 Tax=Adhaeribacter terreus TaxID=529703 RepID=A0ABW0E8R2_9BACT
MNFLKPLIILITISLLISCQNKTEKELLGFIENNKFNYTNLERGYNENVERKFKRSVEYGIIKFPNHDTVKYWFLSHHIANDGYGGTVFELPNKEKKFIKGYFCCEVQLPNNGNYNDAVSFLKQMEKLNNTHP